MRPYRMLAIAAALSVGLPAFDAFGDEPTEEVVEADPGQLPPSTTRGRMLLTGVALTAGWYGASLGTSYLWSDAPGARDLRIPVAGPFMSLVQTGCGEREPDCGAFTLVLRTVIVSLSAVGQVGGVAALGEALFLPTGGEAVRSARPQASDQQFVAVPLLGDDSIGVGVVGRF